MGVQFVSVLGLYMGVPLESVLSAPYMGVVLTSVAY